MMTGVHDDCCICGIPLDDEAIECDKCGRKMHYDCVRDLDLSLPFHYCDDCELDAGDPS